MAGFVCGPENEEYIYFKKSRFTRQSVAQVICNYEPGAPIHRYTIAEVVNSRCFVLNRLNSID